MMNNESLNEDWYGKWWNIINNYERSTFRYVGLNGFNVSHVPRPRFIAPKYLVLLDSVYVPSCCIFQPAFGAPNNGRNIQNIQHPAGLKCYDLENMKICFLCAWVVSSLSDHWDGLHACQLNANCIFQINKLHWVKISLDTVSFRLQSPG